MLTGAAGLESLEADTLIGADSGFWSLGPRLEWPIFAAGQIRNAVRAEEAQVEAALAAYEQTVLLALQDVESRWCGTATNWRRGNGSAPPSRSTQRRSSWHESAMSKGKTICSRSSMLNAN